MRGFFYPGWVRIGRLGAVGFALLLELASGRGLFVQDGEHEGGSENGDEPDQPHLGAALVRLEADVFVNAPCGQDLEYHGHDQYQRNDQR
jgi:hypothetical protein